MSASMSETRNLTLTIGGRNHVISIAPGEEDHLVMLAQMIDERVRKLGLAQSQTEARMLLIAGLVLADELHALQTGGSVAPPPPPPPPPPAPAVPPKLLAQMTELADRVEKLAARLEQSGEDA